MVTENRSTLGGDPIETNPMAGNLQVQIDVSENTDNENSMVYRLDVTVTATNNFDPYIFIFEGVPTAAGRDADQLRFVTVATPVYMQELPIEVPSGEHPYYCRKDVVELYFRTPTEIDSARENILRRINLLLEGIESMTEIRESMIVNYEFDTDEEYLGDSSSLGA